MHSVLFGVLGNCNQEWHLVDKWCTRAKNNVLVLCDQFLWHADLVCNHRGWLLSCCFAFQAGHIWAKDLLCNVNVIQCDQTVGNATHLEDSLEVSNRWTPCCMQQVTSWLPWLSTPVVENEITHCLPLSGEMTLHGLLWTLHMSVTAFCHQCASSMCSRFGTIDVLWSSLKLNDTAWSVDLESILDC